MTPRLTSLLGLIVIVILAWSLSQNRRQISWRLIAMGLALQFGFALLILKTDVGRAVFDATGGLFKATIDHVEAGSSFMFSIPGNDAPNSLLTTIAFGVLPTIIFFSSLMSILYYLGVMQRLVEWLAWLMQRTLGTSGAESLSAAANIFVGQTEAPLVIQPYIGKMTLSELNAVMVGGFATIAGGVMAIYVAMGVDAGHLLTASVISAPAALLIAKLMIPETEVPETLGRVQMTEQKRAVNVVEAAAVGAADGMKLAINVGAMLIAFLALLSLVNGILGWLDDQWYRIAGPLLQLSAPPTWSLEGLLAYLFAPLAWIMGIPWQDCGRAGELLGIKVAANEFLAYDGLGRWRSDVVEPPQPRTVLILTYALSGFANFGSIGIQIGGIGAIAPERRSDLARLGMRAMIGGTLAAFMTACVAGFLTSDLDLQPQPSARPLTPDESAEKTPKPSSEPQARTRQRSARYQTWSVAAPVVGQQRDAGALRAYTNSPHLRGPIQIVGMGHSQETLAVINRRGSISVIDRQALHVVSEFPLGQRLADAARVDSDRLILVSPRSTVDAAAPPSATSDAMEAQPCFESEVLLVSFDATQPCQVLHRLKVAPEATHLSLAPDGHTAIVSSSWAHRLTVIQFGNDNRLQTARTIDLNFAPGHTLILDDQTLIVADAFGGWLAKVDYRSGDVQCAKRLPGTHNISGLALDQDRRMIYLTHQILDGNYPTTKPNVHWGDIMSNVVRRVELDWFSAESKRPNAVDPFHYLGFPDRATGDPAGLLITRDRRFILALAGVDEVSISERGLASHHQRITVGRRPQAMWLSEDERQLFVANQFADSISVIEVATWQVTHTLSLGPMAARSLAEEGEVLFYDARLSSDGWFSCHSCHTYGHTNGGQSDTFGDGYEGSPKQVLSLLGVAETRPWAWDGKSVSLEAQIRKSIETTMRGPEPTRHQVAALAAFLRSLPPPVPLAVARGQLSVTQITRGHALFQREGCADCHTPPLYTTPTVWDVGLRDEQDRTEFNPPSLRGVSHRHRLLHAGQATTIRQALAVHPNGNPLELTEAEWEDLEAFLQTL